jgi:drug/metabolite transporter (DMT)-like permease
MKSDRGLALFAFAIVCIVWGTTYLAIRIAVETIPPLLLTAIRFTIAGVVMLSIARWRGERAPLDRRTLLNLAVIGFLMVAIGNLAVVWAEQWVPSGMAALLVATAPFWMAILEAFRRGGERLDLRGAIGMLIGFLGVGLLVAPRGAGASVDTHFILGALAIQIGSFAWQLGSVRGKYAIKHVPLLTSAALQMLFGGIATGVAGLAIGEASRFAVTPRTLGALAYLTVFGSIIAYSAYVYALAHMRTTHSALYAYINPLVAVILGWLILHERLTIVSIVAMVVILAGVALVQTSRNRPVVAASNDPEAEKSAA